MTAESPKRLRLARASRLAQSRDFARVRQQGQRLVLGCLIANWNRLPDGASPKLGVVTSKKIGGAVQRSRARQLRRAKVSGSISMNLRSRSNWFWWRAIPSPGKNSRTWKGIFWRR